MTFPTPLDQYLQMQELVSHISRNSSQELVTTSSGFDAKVGLEKDPLTRKVHSRVLWRFNNHEFMSEVSLYEPRNLNGNLDFVKEVAERVAEDVSQRILIEVKHEIAASVHKQLIDCYGYYA